MDRFLCLQAFVRVSEVGSFAAAARSLGVSNPVVSERVRQLEDLVGRPLLFRTTRSVTLTEAGARALPIYTDLIRKMDDIENVSPLKNDAVTGRLRVASVIDFGISHIGPALSRLARDNPSLNVELALDNRLVNPLNEGFDVAVHFRHIPPGPLRTLHLVSVENGYFASAGYVDRHGAPAGPDDLRDHRCIGYSIQASTDAWDTARWNMHRGGLPSTVQVALAMTANSGHVLKQLALDGHGIAVLPLRRVAGEVTSGDLVRLLPDCIPETINLSAIYPASHESTYKVQRVLDVMKDAFNNRHDVVAAPAVGR